MKIKKACFYLISFLSIAFMFSICYYLSYKNALKQFNDNAVERNNELILSLENNGLLQNAKQTQTPGPDTDNLEAAQNDKSNAEGTTNSSDASIAVDMTEDTILPSTQFTLQTYDIKSTKMEEEILPTPSYLVGLTRTEVIDYLDAYMEDLSWNEFEKGLTAFELMQFSKQKIVLRKTYNVDLVENKYYIKSQNGYIVVFYGDKKTVYDYTSVSIENLSQAEQMQLEEGIFVKDLDELYAVLENYSS